MDKIVHNRDVHGQGHSMFKIYSKGCEYALRALTKISPQRAQEPFLAKDLCRRSKVPESSTRKVFQKLVHEGLLIAVPGPGGGYKLSKEPKEISLLNIVKAIDGEGAFEKCIMGFAECGKSKPCPVHETWKKVKIRMLKEMEDQTLAQLINVVSRN